MKKQTFLTFFSFIALYSFAQAGFMDNSKSYVTAGNIDNSSLGNSFFIDSTFRNGEAQIKGEIYTTEFKYRYDQVHDRMQARFPSGKAFYLSNLDIAYCKIFYRNDTILFIPLSVSQTQPLSLFQVIYKTATMQLYRDVHKKVRFTRTHKNEYNPSFSNDFSALVDHDYHYYIRKNENEPFKEVDITAKSFIKALPEKRNQITHFFKGKKKTDITMSKLMRFMAELDKHVTLQ